MTLYERLRFRLRMLRLAVSVRPVAGGEETEEEKAEREKREAEAEAERKKGEQKPPWGDEEENFDADRAWELIQNLRGDNDQLKNERDEARGKVKEFEDAGRSDQEKLEQRATTAETTAAESANEAARLRVALKKGLTETQAKRLVGEDEEALEKDADDLVESFKQEDAEEGQEPRHGRPRERLRTGAAPSSEPEESDPAKLAEQVSRSW